MMAEEDKTIAGLTPVAGELLVGDYIPVWSGSGTKRAVVGQHIVPMIDGKANPSYLPTVTMDGIGIGDAIEVVSGSAAVTLGNQLTAKVLEGDVAFLTADDEVSIEAALATIGYVVASSTGPTSVAFFEDADSGTNKITLTAPTSISSDATLTLPTTAGTVARVAAATGVPAASDVADVAPTALTDGATITPDFSVNRNFTLTIGGNRTLANPTNQVAGRSGVIVITQDGTGGRTLAYGTNWRFPGGTDPVLSTSAGAVDLLAYFVAASGTIYANLQKAFA